MGLTTGGKHPWTSISPRQTSNFVSLQYEKCYRNSWGGPDAQSFAPATSHPRALATGTFSGQNQEEQLLCRLLQCQ
jgi:hypothetical protein